jgi:hypothetical protein
MANKTAAALCRASLSEKKFTEACLGNLSQFAQAPHQSKVENGESITSLPDF